MTTERPDSPVGRIAPVPFHYCTDCHCESCGRVFSRTFCPRCSCASCTKDSRDHAYIPEHEEDDQPSALGKRKQESLVLAISPVKRVKADSVNTAIRKLVNEASISVALPVPSNINRFCLVSLGHSPEDCLETCHIIPRALGEDNLQKLEFAWGLRYNGLYLHSRYNLITLTAGLHASFDKGSWALVPLDLQYLDDLQKFFDKKGKWRKELRDDGRMKRFYNGAESFRYALLALPHSDGMRKQIIRSWKTATSASELEPHFFPYDTLPIIHSHIRPHFVVYNLGTKLSAFLHLFLEDQYQPLTSRHPTLLTCVQRSMYLYQKWTCEDPPSDFMDTDSSGDQSGGADVTNANDSGPTRSSRAPKKSGQGSQGAGNDSGSSAAKGSGTVDNEDQIYPDDSITLVFEAAAEKDDASELPDDEHTDDESDESFYARLDTWVTSVRPGFPPPPSPAPTPAHSHAGLKAITTRDTDSEDESTTFVGVMDRKTGGMEVVVGLGEKVCTLSSFSLLNPGTV